MDEKETLSASKLGEMITLYVRWHGLSIRQLADEMGIPSTTVHRIAAGRKVDIETFVKLMAWMVRANGE